ncbi:MAG: T9SS type A sorting domain-containing protein [Bacteroidetes bacterium]|nr:T9SS type A sorting domain-containing protein [Bacteroidota bacterium]
MRALNYLLLLIALGSTTLLTAQSFCNPSGNLIILTNYDGGPVQINVDEDIPNLKIGLSSYEPMVVTITGPFAANVTEIWYAGYNSGDNNNHCAVIPTTSISASAGTVTTIETYPPVTLIDPAGENNMIYSYQCTETPSGGNSPDQVINYFSTVMGGVLYWHLTQYDCFGTVNVSGGGNCCLGACFIPIDAGQDLFICEGQSATLGAIGASSYSWSPGEWLSDPLATNPVATPPVTTVYEVVGTDASGCTGTDFVTVNVAPTPPTPTIVLLPGDTLRCDPPAEAYQWYANGTLLPDTGRFIWATMPGDYTVVTLVGACSSSSSDALDFEPNPPSGLDALSFADWTVFPNPAREFLSVRIPESAIGQHTWQLQDILGRTLLQGSASGHFNIDLQSIHPGTFTLSIQSAKGTLSKTVSVSP